MTILSRLSLLCCSVKIYYNQTINDAIVHLTAIWKAEMDFFANQLSSSAEELIVLLYCYDYLEVAEYQRHAGQLLTVEELESFVHHNNSNKLVEILDRLIQNNWLTYTEQYPDAIEFSSKFHKLCSEWQNKEWLLFTTSEVYDPVSITKAYAAIEHDKQIEDQFIHTTFVRDLTYAATVERERIQIVRIEHPHRMLYHIEFLGKLKKIMLLNFKGAESSWIISKSMLRTYLPVMIQFGRKNIHFPRYYILNSRHSEDIVENRQFFDGDDCCWISSRDFHCVGSQLGSIS